MSDWRRLLAVLAVVVVVVPGCGGTSQATSVASTDGVVFGEGELPATLPEDFPLPPGSVVGSTMVDTGAGLTEVVMRVTMDPADAADFFDSRLGDSGLHVERFAGEGAGWRMEFSDEAASGTIEISPATAAISQIVVRYLSAPPLL